jgi:hypothetical protein
MFKTPFDPYVKRDQRIRHAIAVALDVTTKEVETLPWDEVLAIAKELGIDSGF